MDVGFVYRWFDKSNMMYYVGSHKGSVNDRYIGSGLYFNRAYKKRPEAFAREILYIGENYRELEEFILEELDAMNDSLSYNMKNSSIGGNMGAEAIEKMRLKVKGRIKSDEECKAISKGKIKYSVYSDYNKKSYKTTFDAAEDLGIVPSYVRSMLNGHCTNKYALSKIKKIK